MDNPVLPTPPPFQPVPTTETNIQHKAPLNKKIVIIAIIGIIFTISSAFAIKYYQDNFKIPGSKTISTPTQTPLQLSDTKTSHPLIEGLKSYPKNNAISFAGKVGAKSTNSLVLVAGTQTIKVELDNKTYIRLIDQAEFSKNPKLFLAKPPKYIQLSEIEIGDNVNAIGYGNEKILKAFSIIVKK